MADGAGRRTGIWVWVAVAVLVLAGALWYVRGTREEVPVVTAKVERSDLSVPVSTNGKVEPMQDYQAHASASGEVDKVLVQVGQEVQSGQLLMELDSTDARSRVATAEAQLAQGRQSLTNMRSGGSQDELLSERSDLKNAQDQQRRDDEALATLKQLQGKGSASANEVAQAQLRSDDAHAHVAQLQGRLQGRYSHGDLSAQQAQIQSSQSSLAAAQSALGGVLIRAPFRGTIYSLPKAQFDYVAAGDALLNMADLHHLQVRAYFDEPDIGKLSSGQPVEIRWEARPNRVWHGHVAQVPTTVITYNTRNVGECLITVDDADGDLIPYMNVTVTVTTQQQRDVITLPHEALHTVGADNFVYRVIDGRLRRTPVDLGTFNPTRIQIIHGLELGDTVALSAVVPSTELHDGMHVVSER